MSPCCKRRVLLLTEVSMARERLIPPSPDDTDDTRKPQERFEDFASKLMRVTKDDIDKREREWQRDQQR